MEVELLSLDDLCAEHEFGAWETETPATHSAGGLQHRICTVCGAEEFRATEKLLYTQDELPVTIDGTSAAQAVTLTNQSGEPAYVHMILAAYGSNGQMLAARTVVEELEDGGTLTLAATFGPDAGVEKTAVYLLDPLTLAPLCQAREFSVSDLPVQ